MHGEERKERRKEKKKEEKKKRRKKKKQERRRRRREFLSPKIPSGQQAESSMPQQSIKNEKVKVLRKSFVRSAKS